MLLLIYTLIRNFILNICIHMYLIAIRHKNIIKMNEKAVKIAMSSRTIKYNCSDFQMAFSNDPKKTLVCSIYYF